MFEEMFYPHLQDPNKDSENVVDQGWPTCGPRGKYMRPPVTRIVSVIQLNKHNTIGLQNTIWQIY
jgi:hypothetical protein